MLKEHSEKLSLTKEVNKGLVFGALTLLSLPICLVSFDASKTVVNLATTPYIIYTSNLPQSGWQIRIEYPHGQTDITIDAPGVPFPYIDIKPWDMSH